ncbi:hypothetical protein A2U01_0091175, partial [Trifolium medium]|nr:hypothetical protein [Trifolium medium]
CELRVAQAGVARRAGHPGLSIRLSLPSARRADSYGASCTFRCLSRALRRQGGAACSCEIYINKWHFQIQWVFSLGRTEA